MFLPLLVALVGLTSVTDARPHTSPTGVFYHRINTFVHGNEFEPEPALAVQNMDPTSVSLLMRNRTNNPDACASIGQTVPRLTSQQELNDLMAELNSMEEYGNAVFCNHDTQFRRHWIDHQLSQRGQYRPSSAQFHIFADLNDHGAWCGALFWRDPGTGYILNGQPCGARRQCMSACVRQKFYRQIFRERFDDVSLLHPNNSAFHGRFNWDGAAAKCAHYGKQLVTLTSTQDLLDLQEELNRIGLIKDYENRNFWLATKVDGVEGAPVDIENLVPGNKCLVVGQQHSSNLRGRINAWVAPCTRQGLNGPDDRSAFITLCTDDQPGGRYAGKISLHGVRSLASAQAECARLGKVIPDVTSDEDIMDLGYEMKKVMGVNHRFRVNGFWTTTTTNTWERQNWSQRTPGTDYCTVVANAMGNEVLEIWSLWGVPCSGMRYSACMTP